MKNNIKSYILTSFWQLSWKINCGHNCNLYITLKPLHLKSGGFSPFHPFSLSSLIGEKGRGLHQVDYSGKFVLFSLSGFKVKVGGFRVKFVKLCEWFDGCDRLKIIFKSRKNKITKMSFILTIIKYYQYICLICRRKNIKIYKLK